MAYNTKPELNIIIPMNISVAENVGTSVISIELTLIVDKGTRVVPEPINIIRIPKTTRA